MTQSLNREGQTAPLTRKVKLATVDPSSERSMEIDEEERLAIMRLLDLRDLSNARLWTNADGNVRWWRPKLSMARWVCAPYSAEAGTFTSPILSRSIR
jgi:hypothetical protein